MKNKFCTIFLYLFALDGILGLFRGITTLLGSDISHGLFFQLFAGAFSFGIVICAIVQITIGFVMKLRWSARIIGMYVIFYSIISAIIGFVFGVYSGLLGINAVEKQSLMILKSSFFNVYGIIIGLFQIILFFWALKDLSKGHYLNKK